MIRILARKVQSPRTSPRWIAIREDTGLMLTEATSHPFSEGAYVLLASGHDPKTLVTMRHEGDDHDSFVPMPLRNAAVTAFMRKENANQARTYYENTRTTPPEKEE